MLSNHDVQQCLMLSDHDVQQCLMLSDHDVQQCLMLSDIFHFNGKTVLITLTLIADSSAFMIIELDSRRVRPVNRGCLLLIVI
jgi:hypothetical protein